MSSPPPPPHEGPCSASGDPAPGIPGPSGGPDGRGPSLLAKATLVGILLLLTVLQVTFAVRRSLENPAQATPAEAATLAPVATTGPLAAIAALPGETQARRERGYRLYKERGCARCHGDVGQGSREGPSLLGRYLDKQPAQVSAAIESGKDEIHRKMGTQEEELDITTFVTYVK